MASTMEVLQAIRANKKMNFFNFKQVEDGYFLTNDTGAYLFLNSAEFDDFLTGQYEYQPTLKKQLSERAFVRDENRESFVNRISSLVRQSKSYLMEGTQLHIFVLTPECNHQCVYCQASAHLNKAGMSLQTAQKAVDLAFQSPSQYLSFEFQGGEPLLNFEALQFIIAYTAKKNEAARKNIQFSVVSNLSKLSDAQLHFLLDHQVHISTSLDGPQSVQDRNRPSFGSSSYGSLVKNIARINQEYHKRQMHSRVQAIQTTTRYSLSHAKEIIEEYVRLGFTQIFLRPVAPYGFAKMNWEQIGFEAQAYLDFYQECLHYILELNQAGYPLKEGYASLFLNKILGDRSVNYMELRSPCGGTIGQLAYHYDGSVYSCDEGRMLGESGDESFKVGSVNDDYLSLIENATTKTLCISSCLESLPECSDCVYQPYCGTCPIFNYSSKGNVFTTMSSNFKCQVHKGMLDILFQKLRQADPKILYDWAVVL